MGNRLSNETNGSNATLATGDQDESEELEEYHESQSEVIHISNYPELSEEAQALDMVLYNALTTICKGTIATLLQDLDGDYARYTFAIITLWRHAELSASSRRLEALSGMQSLQYTGDAGKWKIDFLNKARQVFQSKLTIVGTLYHELCLQILRGKEHSSPRGHRQRHQWR